jgi:hypothetical protein
MLSKVGKPATACREANYSRDTINISSEAVAGKIGISWLSIAAGPPESDSRMPTTHEFSRKFTKKMVRPAKNT